VKIVVLLYAGRHTGPVITTIFTTDPQESKRAGKVPS
jgi:hypothetical protein